MSWIPHSPLSYLQQFGVNVIKCGPIPKHIAIIMDGNRRYSKKAKVERSEGHVRGFHKLAETLEWCLELGIPEVTVYAFSIENFKRSQSEVDTLMKFAIERFQALLGEMEKIMCVGVCIRIIGDISLLPEELQKLMAEAVLMTKDNTRGFLNIAVAYTSRDEIVTATKKIVDGVAKGAIEPDDIDEDLVSRCLYTRDSPDPDIIIRTSGEVRFSDYLLWQISDSYICFTDVLWPEFSIWQLLVCVFKYQRRYNDLKKKNVKKIRNERVENFVEELQQKHLTQLKSYMK